MCSPPHRAVTLGWPALPRGATCSLLHLVELRSQFVSYRSLDTRKLNRPYVMDAYGAWPVDEHRRLPSGANARAAADAVRAASGAPSDATVSSLRAIRLGRPLLEATSDHDGVGGSFVIYLPPSHGPQRLVRRGLDLARAVAADLDCVVQSALPGSGAFCAREKALIFATQVL